MALHIVFDFDCTLTETHLYHTMHSGSFYLEHLKNNISPCWDSRSMRVFDFIQQSESKWQSNDDDSQFGHKPGLLNDVPYFTNYIFGGPERIEEIRTCLKYLHSTGAKLHISTKGIVSDVIDMLKNVCFIEFFTYIDGMDDTYETKRLYHVGKGFCGTQKTFYAKDRELIGLKNPYFFEFKHSFINHLVTSKSNNQVIYLDDDDEYYKDEYYKGNIGNVLTIDIGTKEQYYKTGNANLSSYNIGVLKNAVEKFNSF